MVIYTIINLKKVSTGNSSTPTMKIKDQTSGIYIYIIYMCEILIYT